MRTISAAPPTEEDQPDIDGQIVDGIESLRQRIVQAIQFRAGSWYLRRTAGVQYELLLGHRTTPALAAATISETIREEGGNEVTALRRVTFGHDSATRTFRYSAEVDTIYGLMTINEAVG